MSKTERTSRFLLNNRVDPSVAARLRLPTRAPLEFHQRLDGYLPTPPHELPEIAAARASTGDVAAMRAHNERLIAALKAGDPVAARDSDREFHAALVALADTPYMSSAVEPLLMHARRLETHYFSDQEPCMQSYREHQRIIDAVRVGDTETAGRLTRHNFGRFWTPAGTDALAESPSGERDA